MKNSLLNILFLSILSISCQEKTIEKQVVIVDDEVKFRQNCSMISANDWFVIDMNGLGYKFGYDEEKLNISSFSQMDSLFVADKERFQKMHIMLLGRKNVSFGKMDSVMMALQKHKRYRYHLVYQKDILGY
jgi:hypothetical protein